MRKPILAAATITATAAIVAIAGPAYAGPQDGGGIHWHYSESANGYWRQPHSTTSGGGGGTGGPPTVFVDYGQPGEWLKCNENDPAFMCSKHNDQAGVVGILCSGPTGDHGMPLYPWIRYERQIKNGKPTPWVGKDGDCSEPNNDNFVSMQEISNKIDYDVFQPLKNPGITIAPQNKTIVGFPTIVSTDYPKGITAPAKVLSIDPTRVSIPVHIDRPGGGLDGQITAEASYVWSFEDGGTASGRGKPYVNGVTPQSAPGYYVTTSFQKTGQHSVTLTATWTGQVTVETLAPEDIVPVVKKSTATIDVVQSRALLSGD